MIRKYLKIIILLNCLNYSCEDNKIVNRDCPDFSLEAASNEHIFSLADLNSSSPTYNQIIDENTFYGQVVLYYFPSSVT